MIKPLLRVIPNLSGNVKLACNLFDFNKVKLGENIVYEANVRYAKLLPLSSNIFQKKIDAGLLGSCWNFDLKKFYDTYSDIFYNNCFDFSKDSLLQLDTSKTQYVRNTDMEFGVKRISFVKSGSQFAMFAPFYIDDVKDIPSYFLLDIKLSNGVYDITKSIKINIACNGESKYNYLYRYLKKYVEQIDDNVLFCQPENNQGIYYGIDVRNGGFVKAIDNTIGNIYNVQNTIHNVDSLVTRGFERNKIAMKQIIPLAFYFNINELMTPQELHRYKNQQVSFSGAYYTDKNKKLPFYDFSIDYDEFSQQILKMHPEYGMLTYQDGYIKNIMDVAFPSLNETRYINYQFANKLSADFCRWKLKYSDDDHPYIMNMSWAFSKNTNSNYRYGEFPVNLHQLEALCNYIKNVENNEYQYNLLFPFSDNKELYDFYNKNISQEYESIMNQFCLNWFNVIPRVDDSIFENTEIWKDTNDDCVYYNGILYDLQQLYNTKENPEKVDKFAMLVNPDASILTISELEDLKFSELTLFREFDGNTSYSNAGINNNVLDMFFNGYENANYLYTNEEYNEDKIVRDQLALNEIFTYAYSDGNFIDTTELGLDYYDINKYYDYEESKNIFSYINNKYVKPDKYDKNNDNYLAAYMLSSYYELNDIAEESSILGYLNIPIYKSKMIAYSDVYDSDSTYLSYVRNSSVLNVPGLNEKEELKYLKENLYYRCFDDFINVFNSSYLSDKSYLVAGKHNYEDVLYGNNWYVKHKFIKASYLGNLKDEDFNYTYLESYIEERNAYDKKHQGYSYWKYEDITDSENYDEDGNIINPKAYACYLYKECNDYKKKIGSYVLSYANTYFNEFEFIPISEKNGEIYAIDTFKERTEYTSRFYGDNIPVDKVNQDMDVLWADIYNLQKIFKIYDGRNLILNENNSREFYVKFLNKDHIYYYYIELFKDQNRQYKNAINYILCDNLHTSHSGEEFVLANEYGVDGEPFCTEFADDFSDWLTKDWYNTIYKKKKVWIYDKNYSNHPVVRLVYENIDKQQSFSDWFKTIKYDSTQDIFYTETTKENGEIEKEYFELVFKRTMYRVNKILWDITNIEKENKKDNYHDIYFYRIQQPQEYDSKYSNVMHIEFIDDENIIANKDKMEPDTCLIPMFDNIFNQSETEAQIVAHYKLSNINVCKIIGYDASDPNIDTDTLVNYRYNKNDKKIMIEISDEEKEKYNITKTWKLYNNNYNEFVKSDEYNHLGYKDLNFNTYVDPTTGIKYGFYIIRSVFNNTSNSFKFTGIFNDETVYNLKYLHVINGKNLIEMDKEEQQNYISSIYKQLSPFIDLKPLNMLNYINTIIYPKNYSLNLRYSQYLNNNSNGSNEIDIKKHNIILKKLYLSRYMHNMTPLITETTKVNNEYKLKLKNVKASILDTGRYNSIGDSPIYKEDSYININEPLKVYGVSNKNEIKSYNNIVKEYTPLEFKHFNCSRMINLEEKIIVVSDKKYRYKELLDAQSVQNTIHIFKNYINRGHINQFNDDEILFLINKYNIEYDSTPIGLTLDKSEKLYTLKYVFTLL